MRRLAYLLVAVGVAAAPIDAAQRGANTLTAEDYIEIQRLLTRYHWAADATDGAAWANLFTSDGEYEVVGQYKVKGREQLMELPKKSFGTPTEKSPLHFVTNIWVEPTPEGARGGAYMLMATPGGKGTPITINSIVVYEDVVVKTSEGWRIKSRKTHTADAGLAPSLLWDARPK